MPAPPPWAPPPDPADPAPTREWPSPTSQHGQLRPAPAPQAPHAGQGSWGPPSAATHGGAPAIPPLRHLPREHDVALTPAGRRRRPDLMAHLRRLPRWAVVAAGSACTLALVAGVGMGTGLLDTGRGGVPIGPGALGENEFAAVHTAVGPTEEIVLPVEYDPATITVDGQPAAYWDFAEVFIDPLLTIEAPDAYVDVDAGGIRVHPKPDPVRASAVGQSIDIGPGGGWGLSDQYFIAEYYDPATGLKLAEPRVTAFTLDAAVPTVDVSFAVDGDGVGHLSWDAVPGATRYFVISLNCDSDGFGTTLADIIGDTDQTSWTTIEDDEQVQEDLADADSWYGVAMQNYQFQTFVMAEDELHDEATVIDAAENLKPRAYGVVAMTPDGTSPLSLLEDPTVASRLPTATAANAAQEMGVLAREETGGVGRLPLQYPITMADGRTVLKPVTYDVDAIVESYDVFDGLEKLWYYVPYEVQGTLFSGHLPVPGAVSVEDAKAKAQLVADQAAAARPRTGAETTYSYRTGTVEVTDVSTTAPETPYPVRGTNPLTKYLAANLIAGESFISVGEYVGPTEMTSTGVGLWDALDEALSQNPYALGMVEVTYLEDRQILAVFYVSYPDLAAREADQAAMAAEVQRVVSEVVTDSMSAEQKATALNDYLTASAEYDYGALEALDVLAPRTYPHAWTAEGILLQKKGVCASYAAAFLALADAAGLEAMYVTGETAGGGHAWNKVRVGDTWRALDVTWNDSPAGNDYLLLTDAQMAPTRTEDADWVLDTRVADYAAN